MSINRSSHVDLLINSNNNYNSNSNPNEHRFYLKTWKTKETKWKNEEK